MQQAISTQIGISEYAFTQYLFDAFGFTGLEEEAYYLDAWLTQCKKEGEYYISPAYETRPYEEGFGEEGDDEFVFIDDYDDDFINTKRFRKYRKKSQNETVDESYWLLSPKSKKSLNTQFTREMLVHMHPDAGYQEGQKVRLSSEYGQYDLTVKVDEDVRVGCVVVTSNTRGVNYLTPSIVSEEGESACYQEVKVTIESLENIEE
jgi:hypothetical protein